MSLVNNLMVSVAKGKICTALGIKLIVTSEIVAIAKVAGYDSLFIDLEHSNISLSQSSQLCAAGINSGVTPMVRVPHQCGNGFVQRVLDGGAMGVIFPHISTVDEAEAAAAICKFPVSAPGVEKEVNGKRSLTAALPHFGFQSVTASQIMKELDAHGSTVCLMVETKKCIENIDAIAAVPGVEMLLIGANDLSLELGIQGQWDSDEFQSALDRVGEACKKHKKVFGLAGLYDRPDIARDAVKRLGARYVLGNLDFGLMSSAAKGNMKMLQTLEG